MTEEGATSDRTRMHEALRSICRRTGQHVAAIERTDHHGNVEEAVVRISQIHPHVVAVWPGSDLRPIGKISSSLPVRTQERIQRKSIRVPGQIGGTKIVRAGDGNAVIVVRSGAVSG